MAHIGLIYMNESMLAGACKQNESLSHVRYVAASGSFQSSAKT